jgi:hypothetical protein
VLRRGSQNIWEGGNKEGGERRETKETVRKQGKRGGGTIQGCYLRRRCEEGKVEGIKRINKDVERRGNRKGKET